MNAIDIGVGIWVGFMLCAGTVIVAVNVVEWLKSNRHRLPSWMRRLA